VVAEGDRGGVVPHRVLIVLPLSHLLLGRRHPPVLSIHRIHPLVLGEGRRLDVDGLRDQVSVPRERAFDVNRVQIPLVASLPGVLLYHVRALQLLHC